MTPFYDSQEFYKKMIELQDRLRKSEDERMKLEERFNLLSEDSRSRREACINKLRMRYIDYLEEQRLRDERNHQILGALDKIDGSLARMTARTDRLGILRKQYEAYLLRVYANRSAGGGTGDSGVGSHNEDPKTNISQTGKNPPSTQRGVTQNIGHTSSFIPQTHYPQSYVGASNISQFNVPRYIPGQAIPRVNVMQAHGQGDCSAIDASENFNIPNASVSKTQQAPNTWQEFVPTDRKYPQFSSANNFSRSNDHRLDTNAAHVSPHRLRDTPKQYLQDPRSPCAADPLTIRSQNLTGNREISSSDLQSLAGILHADGANVTATPAFSADFTNDAFGPYRHSTPLPGYLDYSSRYSRDPPLQEANSALNYGFMKSDLEKIIQRNEPILPKDYLHNPEKVKPAAASTAKLSSELFEEKRNASNAKPIGRRTDDDDLDLYINRIRSLHRDNDRSLEALDIDQNTSGDLLNATLSDDGPEQLTLYSDDKFKPNRSKILSADVKGVLALADDFVAETSNFTDKTQFDDEILDDREIPLKICDEGNIVEKSTFHNSNDLPRASLKADTRSGNSATRNDILSGTASVDVNEIKYTLPTANGKFSTRIIEPTASQNNPEVSNSPSQDNLRIFENKSDPEEKVTGKEQLTTKNYDSVPKKIEVHEDIEGDKVSLIEGEQIKEQVIDVVRELQPPSLQHYEKNVVEIHLDDEENENTNFEKEVPDRTGIQDDKDIPIRENSSSLDLAETAPHDSSVDEPLAEYVASERKYSEAEKIDEQTFIGSKKQINEDQSLQPGPEYPAYEHQPEEYIAQNVDDSRSTGQEFEQDSQPLYEPTTNEQFHYDTRRPTNSTYHLDQPFVPASNEPYDPNQVYDANQHYGADPGQDYVQESSHQFDYDPTHHFEGDQGGQYAADFNQQYEQYATHPTEEYSTDQNERYAIGSNEQYATDPNEEYAIGSNEQYAIDPNEQYVTDSNAQYANDSNELYGTNSDVQYPDGSNEHYVSDPTEQYAADPSEQYGYYADQPYQHEPNATYESDGHERYGYDVDQGYEHDPSQQYEHAQNESSVQDYNQEYGARDYDENQSYEPVEYGDSVQGAENQQFENDAHRNYTDHDPGLQSANEDYPIQVGDEQNAIGEATENSHVEELSEPDNVRGKEHLADEKKKNKDVIRALLESDTDSTIERNPSNNTESDFDFN